MAEEESTGRKVLRKLLSVKTWVALAAAVLIFIIVIGDKTDFKDIAENCTWVLLGYLGVNVLQKKVEMPKTEGEK